MPTSQCAHSDPSGDREPIQGLAARARAAQLPPPNECQQIRQRARVSLREMASALGVTAMTLSRWERGQAVPTLDHAITYRGLLDELTKALA
ncbi:helix-turn-helix transcriptional regulator [Streptosporangium sp. NPDC002524]|uniref:helix-turn-helix domain-containing protein n=1 Tax=Streptosporangium sp. NPDC002524 TaxID=3154537 RepID=UPI00331B9FB7